MGTAGKFLEDRLPAAEPTVKVPTSTLPSSNVPVAPPLTSKHGFDRAKYQAGLDREHELLKDIPKDFIERADIGVSNRGALKGIVVALVDKDTGEFITYAEVGYVKRPFRSAPFTNR